ASRYAKNWSAGSSAIEIARRKRLEQQPELQPQDVLIPAIARQRSAVAGIHVRPVAELYAHAELGVHDRLTGRILDKHSRGRYHALFSVQHRPTDNFQHRRERQVARPVQIVMDADAVADDVAGEVGAAHRYP